MGSFSLQVRILGLNNCGFCYRVRIGVGLWIIEYGGFRAAFLMV